MALESYKVRLAQRDHKPLCAPSVAQFRNYNLTDAVPEVCKSIVTGETGKVHYPPSFSMSDDAYRGKARVPREEYSKEWVERGKRALPHPSHPEPPADKSGKKLSLVDSMRRSEATDKLMIGWTSRRFVVNENGVPCAQVRNGRNYDMEGYMNRKIRVPTKEDRRNGIPERTPCDNRVKDSEREAGFYAVGGIIPGSTIQLRESAKPKFVKKKEEDGPMSVSTMRKKKDAPTMTYAEKMRLKERQYDLHQIHCLTKESQALGQTVSSWETRTGLYLVKPEDEAY